MSYLSLKLELRESGLIQTAVVQCKPSNTETKILSYSQMLWCVSSLVKTGAKS